MLKFYSTQEDGVKDGFLCSLKKKDGTYDEIFISINGPFSRINTNTGVDGSMSYIREFNWEKSNASEFLKAYMDASTQFQKTATEMIKEITQAHADA